ncbi:MAG: hypothetical protein AAB573_02150 [Patescibacteria group bacterium]
MALNIFGRRGGAAAEAVKPAARAEAAAPKVSIQEQSGRLLESLTAIVANLRSQISQASEASGGLRVRAEGEENEAVAAEDDAIRKEEAARIARENAKVQRDEATAAHEAVRANDEKIKALESALSVASEAPVTPPKEKAGVQGQH